MAGRFGIRTSVCLQEIFSSQPYSPPPEPAQPPVLPLPGVKRSGHDFYYSLHLALRVSTGTAIVLLLLCVSNDMLRSYLYSLTPEDILKSLID